MSERQEALSPLDRSRVTVGLVALGGVFGAIAASSCCLVPLALFGLGLGGAWMGNLAALSPYQPIFIAATVACLATGYWMVYRKPDAACDDDPSCGRPGSRRWVLVALWSATGLVIAAAAFPYIGPGLLGV